MKIIGLTGGIATGKSTVSNILKEMGEHIVDADQIVHDMYEPGKPGWDAIKKYFGIRMLTHQGVDREKLAKLVFADEDAKNELEKLTHPLIHAEFLRRVGEAAVQGVDRVIYDMPLLFETDGYKHVQKVICVKTSGSTQRKRLMARNNLTEEEAKVRIDAQMLLSHKTTMSDFVIDNDGTVEETRAQIETIWPEVITS